MSLVPFISLTWSALALKKIPHLTDAILAIPLSYHGRHAERNSSPGRAPDSSSCPNSNANAGFRLEISRDRNSNQSGKQKAPIENLETAAETRKSLVADGEEIKSLVWGAGGVLWGGMMRL